MLRTYKIFFSVILAVIFFLSTNVTFAAESANDLLAQIERDTYGSSKEGALLPRLNQLEKDYSGRNLQEDLNTRIESLRTILYDNSTTPSIMAKVNAIEWNFGHEVKSGGIKNRLADIEISILGEQSNSTIIDRVRELARASFGRDDIPMAEVQLPADTLIKVALVSPVGTREGQVGDAVKFQILEDVILNGDLVLARGLQGMGVIETLTKASDWGRNGSLIIDFQKINCIDGQNIDTYVGHEAKNMMTENKMVTGAALVGMDLNDGWSRNLVFGKNLEVPAGTELYIQTKSLSTVYALKSGRGSLSIDKSDSEYGDDLDEDFIKDYFGDNDSTITNELVD